MTVKTETELKEMRTYFLNMLSNINESMTWNEAFKPSPEYWKLVGQINALNWAINDGKEETK